MVIPHSFLPLFFDFFKRKYVLLESERYWFHWTKSKRLLSINSKRSWNIPSGPWIPTYNSNIYCCWRNIWWWFPYGWHHICFPHFNEKGKWLLNWLISLTLTLGMTLTNPVWWLWLSFWLWLWNCLMIMVILLNIRILKQ